VLKSDASSNHEYSQTKQGLGRAQKVPNQFHRVELIACQLIQFRENQP